MRLQVPDPDVVPKNRTIIVEDQQIPIDEIKLDITRLTNRPFMEFREPNMNHIRFKNIEFYNFEQNIIITSGNKNTNHIELDNLKFTSAASSILFNRTKNMKVMNCKFVGHVPLYVGFQETKSSFNFIDDAGTVHKNIQLPAGTISFEALSFSRQCKDILVSDCTFSNMFDGLSATNTRSDKPHWNPENITVRKCHFNQLLDDAITISADARNVNIYNNTYHDVPVGLSMTKAPTNLDLKELGTVYFHHNIVEQAPRFVNRPNHNNPDITFNMGMPLLVTHTSTTIGEFSLKAYHNTFITRNGFKDRWVPKGKTTTLVVPFAGRGKTKPLDMTVLPYVSNEIYNNIFIHENVDYSVFRSPNLVNGREVFDGNVYYRTTAGMFPYEAAFRHMLSAGTGPGSMIEFETLEDVYTNPRYSQTQSYIAAFADIGYNGFESRGRQAESLPVLMGSWKPVAGGPAASGAIDLSSKGWPGLTGESFRGAIPPPYSASRFISEMDELAVSIFPNPCNESFQLNYTLTEESKVTLIITDMTGRIVAQPINNQTQAKGDYATTVITDHLVSGIYLCRVQAGNYHTIKRISCINN